MLNEVLRVIRIANDMTILELSNKSGVSNSYITQIEKGYKNPSINILQKLCTNFDLETSDLFIFDKYHDSIINKKTELECYQLLLMTILKFYEKQNKETLVRKRVK